MRAPLFVFPLIFFMLFLGTAICLASVGLWWPALGAAVLATELFYAVVMLTRPTPTIKGSA